MVSLCSCRLVRLRKQSMLLSLFVLPGFRFGKVNCFLGVVVPRSVFLWRRRFVRAVVSIS